MTKIKEKQRDSALINITLVVLTIHFGIFAMMSFYQSSTPPEIKQKKTMVVKTIQLGQKISSKSIATRQEPLPPPSLPKDLSPEEAPMSLEAPPTPPPFQKEPPSIAAADLEEKIVPKEQKKEQPKKKETPPKTSTKNEKKVVQSDKTKPTKTPKKQEKKKEAPKKQEVKAAVPKKTEEKKVAASETKKEEKKKVKKTEPPKINPEEEAAKAAVRAKQQRLLQNVKESIAKIDKSAHNYPSSNISNTAERYIPAKIEKLEIEAFSSGSLGGPKTILNDQECSYRDELIHRLKLLLRLPEFGEVKLQLTLERSGKVMQVVIISSESGANKKYIEKTLPTVHFPSFGDNFSQHPQYTFLITLSNDI